MEAVLSKPHWWVYERVLAAFDITDPVAVEAAGQWFASSEVEHELKAFFEDCSARSQLIFYYQLSPPAPTHDSVGRELCEPKLTAFLEHLKL